MTYEQDPRVDTYIDALPAWQQEICQQVRDLVHAVDPEVAETVKRRVQPYFVLDGNICALLAAKDHVNVFLYDGAIVPDPEGIITAGHDNTTARTVAIRQNEKINIGALREMFRLLGGGVFGDTPAGLPNSQLAVLPGTSHVTVVNRADLLLPMITSFLDAAMPATD